MTPVVTMMPGSVLCGVGAMRLRGDKIAERVEGG
jgi:hypothetical protein